LDKKVDSNYCLITNDVETTSILNHRLSDKTGEIVLKEGMPRLLELYARHNIKATFFFTGYIAKLYPEVVKMIQPFGHEIGSHGLSHKVENAFDVLSLNEQIEHLKKSKAILEDISGEEVISFRAPAARVNNNIVIALEEAGFKIDSSISSQRLDMLFSFGSLKKLNWITAPRIPYFTEKTNIFAKGDSSILEVPISAFGFPYIGTFMRISPELNRMTRNLLYIESKFNHKPIVFLTHPNEFIDEEPEDGKIQKRGSNFVSYFIRDVLRHKLKIKNLGAKALPILEEELNFFNRNNFKFVTMKEYYIQMYLKQGKKTNI
jgi:peptidoglycan/xylan/chitin deacetylase (PgdA/CDA1 family)